jgi:hypothetical protein
MTILFSRLAKLCLKFFAVHFVLMILSVNVMAVTINRPIQECDVKTPKITISSMLNLGTFLPIVPESCAKDKNGSAVFISPSYLPTLMLRGYGFLVSLVFYSFTPVIIFAGIIKMLSATDFAIKEFNANKIAENAAMGLIIAFLAYASVFTILAIIRVKPEIIGANLDSFFSF